MRTYQTLLLALILCSSATADDKLQQEFYKPDHVQTIHLTVSKEQLAKMKSALPRRVYVTAKFRWRDITLDNVMVRYKGNSSSRPNLPFKRSWLIRFDKIKKTQRFLGLQRISLDNGIQFGSLFSEPILTEILRAEGVVTHRTNYARLMLNGKFFGVYGNVERIDKTFLRNRFKNAAGLLYKVDEGGPASNLQYRGDNLDARRAYQHTFEAKTKAAQNQSELIELLKVIKAAPAKTVAAEMRKRWEWRQLIKTMPILLFGGAFDQLTGFNPHNYYLYRDPQSKKWRYLPWDLDVGFADNAFFGRVKVIDQWHAAWPIGGMRPNPLMERILSSPELLKEYRAEAKRVLEKYFRPADMNKRLDVKYNLVREYLKSDPFPKRRITNPRDRGYDGIVQSMKAFFKRRYETAKKQLADPGERPKYKPTRSNRPRGVSFAPGTIGEGAPSELRIVRADRRGVVLKWTDNGKNEAGYILQRAVGNGKFRNHIAQPGNNITSATDRRIRPGTFRYRVFVVIKPQPGQRPKTTKASNTIEVKVE